MAKLIPLWKRAPEKIRVAIEDLKAFQEAHSLDALSVREIIEEGENTDGVCIALLSSDGMTVS